MTLPTVKALIEQAMAENHPDLSIAQLERQARKRKSYIQQWCDSRTMIELPPQNETVIAMAKVLGVRSGDLYLAFLRDATGVTDEAMEWQHGLTTDQRRILDLYEETPPAKRHMLIGVLELFAGGFQPSPSNVYPELDHDPPTEPCAAHVPAQTTNGASPTATTSHPDAVAS